jgi:hypothetical protein
MLLHPLDNYHTREKKVNRRCLRGVPYSGKMPNLDIITRRSEKRREHGN